MFLYNTYLKNIQSRSWTIGIIFTISGITLNVLYIFVALNCSSFSLHFKLTIWFTQPRKILWTQSIAFHTNFGAQYELFEVRRRDCFISYNSSHIDLSPLSSKYTRHLHTIFCTYVYMLQILLAPIVISITRIAVHQ